MDNQSKVSSSLFQALFMEAKRIHEDALFCCAGHSHEARYWDSLQLWLGIPATIGAALAGVTSLAGQSSSGGFFLSNTGIIAGILALLVAVLSGLTTFLDPKGQAAKHYGAVNSYAVLLNDARFFYSIDCLHNGDLNKLGLDLRKLSRRLNELSSQTPLLSARSASLAKKSIQAGNYEYQVDQQQESKGKID